MPHDKRGNLIEEGDTVSIAFTVTAVHGGDDYCNLSLETVDPMYPGEHKSAFTANAKQAEVVATSRPRPLVQPTGEPTEPATPSLDGEAAGE